MTKTDPHRAKMAPRADAPPGLETDGEGNMIPYAQRTQEDKIKVDTAIHDALRADSPSLKNPQNEAEDPGAMPKDQQGQGGAPEHHDIEGQQGGTEGGGRERR
jgi:hypothetical protein